MDNLKTIAENFRFAMDSIEVNEDGEILNVELIETLQGEFTEKAKNVAFYIQELEAMAEACDKEAKKYAERKKGYQGKAEWLRSYLTRAMNETNTDKIETPEVKISFRTSSAVNIFDEFLIPDEFMKTVTEKKPNKVAIKDAIKSGQYVAGAEIVESKKLQIK